EPFHGGWPTSYWVHILKSGTSQQRVNAAQTLSEIGPATPEVVPALIAALADEEEFVIRGAAASLGKFPPDVMAPAVPALIRALKDKDQRNRLEIVSAFGGVGEKNAKEVVPLLIEAVRKDPDALTRVFAIVSLKQLGPEAQAAIPTLIEALKDPGSQYAHPADEAKGALEAFGPAATPALLEAIHHANPRIRAAAASLLGNQRAEAQKIVPSLTPLLKDQDRSVRLMAAQALWALDRQTRDTLPIFLEALEDRDYNNCMTAVITIGEIGPEAGAAVPKLITMLQN